jgi:hypothetical protein
MQYGDLNLKKIRDDNGLDFAHFTYQRGMCSCCYGPLDLPKRYWRGGKKPVEVEGHYELDGQKVDTDNIQYILFKNADNGSGHVKRTDEIDNYTCIGWDFPMEKLEKICKDLQEQLGDKYVVLMPTDIYTCIQIFRYDFPYLADKIKERDYIDIRKV